MPLPLLIAGIVAGAAGVGTGVHGAVKMNKASNTIKEAQSRHEKNVDKFEYENRTTIELMDELGTLELAILDSFKEFSDLFEQIHNRPHFESYNKNGVKLPKYDGKTIKDVSIGAGALLGGIGGAGLGAAGGFAAAGATTSAVMAFGTASTGTAIASLHGAALTNATLAALGGGSLAAGGGGVAAGTAVLGATTFGVGLLVGGVIFNFTGRKLSSKADEAWDEMIKAEKQINKICYYFIELRRNANKYIKTLNSVNRIYKEHLEFMRNTINILGHTDWNTYALEEKVMVENTTILVQLLYNMCKVELVLKSKNENDINEINKLEINKSIDNANSVMKDKFCD